MIRFIFYLIVSMASIAISFAQGNKYEQGMQKAFELWGQDKEAEASNLFERIASAEKENWLPYYYVAQINTIVSFGEQDEEKLSLQLEKAKKYLDQAKELSPENPELIVMEALINTAWISFDGAKYGMTLSGKNTELYKEALELAPKNPRVILSKAEWDMGSARFFGQDTTPYCKDVEKALELFRTFKKEIKFYPGWGERRAEQILESCGKQ
ncbi:hypothetical protein GWK08_11850 [Leptobacterium flavescens]|uniref:Tetratricopeptide repeat protein n=1 Tax=Leptobacterium flavescens TaxID=472055 RepID=A0A6P0UQ81_9FLAO|nr:hypothetical protein [Leptobacterium flavescens]NER14138.1 hypothetical protein [Leptobacterium flavescens]